MRTITRCFFWFATTVCFFAPFGFVTVYAQTAKPVTSGVKRSGGNSQRSAAASLGQTIIPGVGIGAVKIGDSLDQIFRLYPKLNQENYYPASGDCRVAELVLPNSLDLYLIDGRVSQIKADQTTIKGAATPATPEGIKPGSTPALVKKYNPHADQAYTDLGGGSASIGYAPPIFWVDRQAGIGFEFLTDSRRGRLVNRIYIFAPNGKPMFGGPCETDPDVRELSPFALTVPQKMISDYEKQ